MQSHVVFGAGLIGCFLGGVLTSQGRNTKLVCRETVRQKLHNGLLLTDYDDNRLKVEKLQFIDSDATETAPCDVLWLTVKCTAVEQAREDIAPFVGPDTTIMCCQNGLGSDALVKARFPDNQVLRVMVPFNVSEQEAGHFHRGSEGELTLEVNDVTAALVEKLVSDIACPIMPIGNSEDMQALLWAKLQLNLGNSINALADIPVKAMLEQRGYRRVIAAMMVELLAVTDALNIPLPKVTSLPGKWLPFVLRLPDFLFTRVANKMLQIDPLVRTSMWWDLSLGKKTEIAHLNGAIVNAAKQAGLDCPINEAVIRLIKQQESSNDAGRPRTGISADELLSLTGIKG